jgi:hypothetical protein
MCGKSLWLPWYQSPAELTHHDSKFGLAFLEAKERSNARTRHGSFNTSVIEVNKADLTMFLQSLCNGS